MTDTSKQAVVEEIRKVMRQALDNLPTRLEDGEEVYADMDAVDLILDINKKLSEAIWRMK
jgi:tyrosyl-tRNA synthetase